jgi:hypothetical protein
MEQVFGATASSPALHLALAAPDTRFQVDAYLFPCPSCGSAAAQVQELYNYWVANGVNVTLLWLDIEGSQYWLGDAGRNQVSIHGFSTSLQLFVDAAALR